MKPNCHTNRARRTARRGLPALIALSMGVMLASLSAGAGAQGLPRVDPSAIKVDCERQKDVCEAYKQAIASMSALQFTYLRSVGACARVEACSKGIKPNDVPTTQTLQRTIASAFEICYAICASKADATEQSIAICMKEKNCGTVE